MHITILDGLIVILCIGALLRGHEIGLLRQVGSTVAFVAGLYPGTLLSTFAMSKVSGPTKPVVGLCVLLTVCFAFMTIAELITVRLKIAIRNRMLQHFDNISGALTSVVTLLLGLWLAGALFSLAPPSKLQSYVKNSAIMSALTKTLPPAGSVLSTLNQLIDPNQSPAVFTGREPSPAAHHQLPSKETHGAMLARVRAAIVKVEGLGCGGIVDGSGFLYAPHRIATNAHVIAGVSAPKITDSDGTHNTTVVFFDPLHDIAVLRVDDVAGQPLPLRTSAVAPGTAAFALGYPGGGAYQVTPGVVLDQFSALGQDIYGKQRTTRTIYSVQASVVRGNSGGPVVDTAGNVIGVVFATSTTYNNVGYALTAEQVAPLFTKAATHTSAVSTGTCSQ